MTKAKWASVILLTAVLITTVLHRIMASNPQQPHQSDYHHRPDQPTALPPLLVDGAKNPDAVPDVVAYEFLFNSVADGAGTTQPEKLRASYLAQKTGLNERNLRALTDKANDFRQGLDPLDAQAKELKDSHWPTPPQWVMDNLADLQRQKEVLLKERFEALLMELDEKEKGILNQRVLEIKKKVKIYQDTPVEKFQRR
jgi:hypothetical protein